VSLFQYLLFSVRVTFQARGSEAETHDRRSRSRGGTGLGARPPSIAMSTFDHSVSGRYISVSGSEGTSNGIEAASTRTIRHEVEEAIVGICRSQMVGTHGSTGEIFLGLELPMVEQP